MKKVHARRRIPLALQTGLFMNTVRSARARKDTEGWAGTGLSKALQVSDKIIIPRSRCLWGKSNTVCVVVISNGFLPIGRWAVTQNTKNNLFTTARSQVFCQYQLVLLIFHRSIQELNRASTIVHSQRHGFHNRTHFEHLPATRCPVSESHSRF